MAEKRMPSFKPVWGVQLTRTLQQAGSRFSLRVEFTSHARRVALFGPSGAGKSQTLRCMAGLVQADAALVVLQGHTLEDTQRRIRVPPAQRRLAYVAQDYALFPHLTVRQNVAFGLHRRALNPPALPRSGPAGEATERWLQQMELLEVARLYPHQLSGGQRQRTALARALVAGPRAILLDEPFAALDRPLQRRLRADLLALQHALDIPMMLITHDEDDLQAFAGDVIELQAGRVTAHRSSSGAMA